MERDPSEDWARAHAAAQVASSRPDLLLASLRALQPIAPDIKHHLLDTIGKTLALASIDQPTLAECRATLAAPDEEARIRRDFARAPAPANIDEILIAFILDALGCATESTSRTPSAAPFERPAPARTGGSSAELVATSNGYIETASCTIAVERTHTFFPGDVNEPARESEHVSVLGTHRTNAASVRVRATVGERDISILVDAPLEQRDRIHVKFWRAFGESSARA